MSFNTSKATKLANKATSARLSSVLQVDATRELSLLGVEVMHSNEVGSSLRDQIWSLFEENMYKHYRDSSFGWNPASKREELFHSLSRFIIVRDDKDTLLAFLMFRFEHEYDQDMIYCYDVQVASTAQGKGLGKKLFFDLEKVCKEFSLEKITLTLLKRNKRASDFYKSIGFTLDPSSPSNHLEPEEAEEVEYEILSKVIQSAAT